MTSPVPIIKTNIFNIKKGIIINPVMVSNEDDTYLYKKMVERYPEIDDLVVEVRESEDSMVFDPSDCMYEVDEDLNILNWFILNYADEDGDEPCVVEGNALIESLLELSGILHPSDTIYLPEYLGYGPDLIGWDNLINQISQQFSFCTVSIVQHVRDED